jgi:hypothetical protein
METPQDGLTVENLKACHGRSPLFATLPASDINSIQFGKFMNPGGSAKRGGGAINRAESQLLRQSFPH